MLFAIVVTLVAITDRYGGKCDGPHEMMDPANPDMNKKFCTSSTSLTYSCKTPVRNLPPGQPLNIVLLGKIGHGKSETANSIFGDKRFESMVSSNSATSKCQKECGVIGGREICLVDTPGTMETRKPLKVLQELGTAITLVPQGFDAFLIVISADVRMTEEDEKAISMLQKMFGSDVLVKYGVVVFTHGDVFRKKIQKGKQNITFQEHIESQTGYINSILKNCSYRYALIDNFQEDPGVLRDEVIQIIALIDKLVVTNNAIRYTNYLFVMAQEKLKEEQKILDDKKANLERDRLLIEALKTQYEKKMREHEEKIKEHEEERNRKEEAAGERIADEVSKKGSCFPPDALVTLSDGRQITIAEIRIGDYVLSMAAAGKLVYSEVFFFAHLDPDVTSEYIHLNSPKGNLKLTPEHHIYIIRNGLVKTIAAREVKVGDSMLILNQNTSALTDTPITDVSKSTEVGVYAPITMSGTIIVSNVLVSCYVDIVPPIYSHPMLWPLRQLYRLSPSFTAWINAEGKNGMPTWVQLIMDNLLS